MVCITSTLGNLNMSSRLHQTFSSQFLSNSPIWQIFSDKLTKNSGLKAISCHQSVSSLFLYLYWIHFGKETLTQEFFYHSHHWRNASTLVINCFPSWLISFSVKYVSIKCNFDALNFWMINIIIWCFISSKNAADESPVEFLLFTIHTICKLLYHNMKWMSNS